MFQERVYINEKGEEVTEIHAMLPHDGSNERKIPKSLADYLEKIKRERNFKPEEVCVIVGDVDVYKKK